MEIRIWLSYDLGADGDYAGMYAWLDCHNANGKGMGNYLKEKRDHTMTSVMAARWSRNDK